METHYAFIMPIYSLEHVCFLSEMAFFLILQDLKSHLWSLLCVITLTQKDNPTFEHPWCPIMSLMTFVCHCKALSVCLWLRMQLYFQLCSNVPLVGDYTDVNMAAI